MRAVCINQRSEWSQPRHRRPTACALLELTADLGDPNPCVCVFGYRRVLFLRSSRLRTLPQLGYFSLHR